MAMKRAIWSCCMCFEGPFWKGICSSSSIAPRRRLRVHSPLFLECATVDIASPVRSVKASLSNRWRTSMRVRIVWGLETELGQRRVRRQAKHTSSTAGCLTSNTESEGGSESGEEVGEGIHLAVNCLSH